VRVLEYESDGNSSYLVRIVKDEFGDESLEYVNILTIPNNYLQVNARFDEDDDDFIYNPRDSLEISDGNNKTRAARHTMNRCPNVRYFVSTLIR
jgi:hypothetical protein